MSAYIHKSHKVSVLMYHLICPVQYGQAFLSSTTLDGMFVLRACIVNPRTTRDDLERLVALVRDMGAQLIKGVGLSS